MGLKRWSGAPVMIRAGQGPTSHHTGILLLNVGSSQLDSWLTATAATGNDAVRFFVDFLALTLYMNHRATDQLKQRPPTFTVFARADGKW